MAKRQRRVRDEIIQEKLSAILSDNSLPSDLNAFDDPLKLLEWLAESDDADKEDLRYSNTPSTGSCLRSTSPSLNVSSAHEKPTLPSRGEACSGGLPPSPKRKIVSADDESAWEVKYLKTRGITCFDRRNEGGDLIVIADRDALTEIAYLRSCGIDLRRSKNSSNVAPGKLVWLAKPDSSNDKMTGKIVSESDFESNRKRSFTKGSAECVDADRLTNADFVEPLAVPELVGLLFGISCDGRVNVKEAKTLRDWLSQVDARGDRRILHVKNLLERYLADDVIDAEEERELLSIFNKIIDLAMGTGAKVESGGSHCQLDNAQQDCSFDSRRNNNKCETEFSDGGNTVASSRFRKGVSQPSLMLFDSYDDVIDLPLTNGLLLSIKPGSILCVESIGSWVSVYAQDTVYQVGCRLSCIEKLLDERQFLKVHRSFLVNKNAVEEIRERNNGTFSLTLKGVNKKIPAHSTLKLKLISVFGEDSIRMKESAKKTSSKMIKHNAK